jgi:addiction module HigA family antidote
MLKRNLPPAHPGEILREMFIKELNLTITEVADGLGVARGNLSAIVNERAGISPELAVKLSEAFGNTSEFWINLQKNYELWHAEKKVDRKDIRQYSVKVSKVEEPRGENIARTKSKNSNSSFFIERRADGDWAIRRTNSERASAVEETQRKAIERARQMNPNATIHVERVRNTSSDKSDHWRKA